jgi:stalled ribosome alternative rescue factor ArfA
MFLDKKIQGQIKKMSPEQLEEYMHFKKRGGAPRVKKGKGSYSRKKKHSGRL